MSRSIGFCLPSLARSGVNSIGYPFLALFDPVLADGQGIVTLDVELLAAGASHLARAS